VHKDDRKYAEQSAIIIDTKTRISTSSSPRRSPTKKHIKGLTPRKKKPFEPHGRNDEKLHTVRLCDNTKASTFSQIPRNSLKKYISATKPNTIRSSPKKSVLHDHTPIVCATPSPIKTPIKQYPTHPTQHPTKILNTCKVNAPTICAPSSSTITRIPQHPTQILNRYKAVNHRRASWMTPKTAVNHRRASCMTPKTAVNRRRASCMTPKTAINRQRSSSLMSRTAINRQRSSSLMSRTADNGRRSSSLMLKNGIKHSKSMSSMPAVTSRIPISPPRRFNHLPPNSFLSSIKENTYFGFEVKKSNISRKKSSKKEFGKIYKKNLFPKKVRALSPKKVRALSPKKVKALSPKKVKALSPKKVKALSPKKVKASSPKKVKASSPRKVKVRKPSIWEGCAFEPKVLPMTNKHDDIPILPGQGFNG